MATKKRRKKTGRKAAKRSAPATKKRRRKARRKNPAASAPVVRSNGRRHRRRASKHVAKRRRTHRRRNPSFGSILSTVTHTALGGLGAYGAVYAVKKIAIANPYLQTGAVAAAPLAVGIGAMMLGQQDAAKAAFGAFWFQAIPLGQQAYEIYKANASKTGAQGIPLGARGMRGLPVGRVNENLANQARLGAVGRF